MLSYLLNQLTRSFTVFLRTIRAFFTRRMAALVSRVRQLMNLTRGATKLATTSLQSATAAAQKPSKREDYIETGSLLVAKAFLIKLCVILVAIVLVLYFLVWPFVLGHFLTARFYVEDDRISNWTGRVIVFSDKKKTVPMYEGRLEDGLLEDQGREYDEDGILSYEGGFLHGKRSGKGTSYQDGLISYKGDFLEGEPSGSGTSYNSAGEMTYQGQFADGLPEGEGKEYEKGRMVYQGGFSAGLYSGQGTLYPAAGEKIDAEFLKGKPDGAVTWSRDGQTYYQGEWGGDRPEGFGTLFSKSGKKLYQGQMACGTLDGQWLLTLTLDELKEVLGEGHTVSSQENGRSFLLSSPDLGLVARCNYQTDENESQVYSIYLFQPKDSDWLRLLPGSDRITMAPKGDITDRKTGPLQFNPPKGVEVPAGSYESEMIYTEDARTTLLRKAAGGPAVLMTWSRLEEIPVSGLTDDVAAGGASGGAADAGGAGTGAGAGGASASGGAAAETEAFLSALDGMQGAAGTESVPGDYCGETPVADAFRACTTPEQMSALVGAMTDYWLQSETQAGLEENLRRVQDQLDDANAGKTMGNGGNTGALEQQKVTLEGQIASCRNQRARAQVTAKEAAGLDPANYAAGEILVRFDPAGLDINNLVPTAAAYAKATGKEPDSAALELEIKTLLVEMRDSYGRIRSAADSYRLSGEQAQSAAGSYAMGGTDRAAWYAALTEQVNVRLELYAAAAEFTGQANKLNALTGGWVSRTCNWYSREMGAVFENAIQETEVETPDLGTEAVLPGNEEGVS